MPFGGRGQDLLCKLTKQNLRTKSSTKAKLVGANKYFLYTLCTKMFMQAQGYDKQANVLEQDNTSTPSN